ncbi:ATP-binding protein [Jeotgalibacillus sp. ET6]|uniref:PAS domain-containing sensor histidine kinase n=1 Tax=Jeotgalibacillus sp. ET6 TaxID=3037260 RepID=UPI00241899E8|nr:PAS domain-containing sensor histidine kinase [Jeotgalibacillus sp. ET6]MDG5473076.1 ATP-binding protein [Jeotgalibacillus sp. ET6]
MEVEVMTLQKFGKLQENWSIKDTLQPVVMEEVALQVLMNMSEGVLLFNDKGKILLYNSTASQFLQLESSSRLAESITDLMPQEDHAGFYRLLLSLIKEKRMTDHFVFKSGGIHLKCKCDLILIERDSVVLLIIRDFTEIKPSPEEEVYQQVFTKSMHGLLLSDLDGNIVTMNQQAAAFLSIDSALCSNYTMKIFKDHEITLSLDNDFQKKLSPYLHSDNLQTSICQFEDRFYEVVTERGITEQYTLTVLRDVTEMVQMMEQMNKHDTLKIVGQLAAGIAHEIRNPMTALKGFIQLLESSVKEDHSMYFGVIMSELHRIETIMTEFLMLAKPKASSLKNVNLANIIRETADLMQAQATLYNIELSVKSSDQELELYGDANRLKQVFINLVKNGIEAISEGGQISLNYHTDKYAQYVTVKDSGCGIPEDHLKKLNQPFYTTKENGTGLGLVVSYKIVEEHGGRVEVKSWRGKGSVFTVIFPFAKDEENV